MLRCYNTIIAKRTSLLHWMHSFLHCTVYVSLTSKHSPNSISFIHVDSFHDTEAIFNPNWAESSPSSTHKQWGGHKGSIWQGSLLLWAPQLWTLSVIMLVNNFILTQGKENYTPAVESLAALADPIITLNFNDLNCPPSATNSHLKTAALMLFL